MDDDGGDNDDDKDDNDDEHTSTESLGFLVILLRTLDIPDVGRFMGGLWWWE